MLKPHEVMNLPDGKYCDSDYLWLYVRGGSRAWIVRTPRMNGKRREIGLGSANTVSLTFARQRRDALLKQLREIGPAENAETWAKRKIVQITERAKAQPLDGLAGRVGSTKTVQHNRRLQFNINRLRCIII